MTTENYVLKEYYKNFKLEDSYIEKLRLKLQNHPEKLLFLNEVVSQDKSVIQLVNDNYTYIINKFEEVSDIINKIEEYSNNINENTILYKIKNIPNSLSSMNELDRKLIEDREKNAFSNYYNYFNINNSSNNDFNDNEENNNFQNAFNCNTQRLINNSHQLYYNKEKRSVDIINQIISDNNKKVEAYKKEIKDFNKEIDTRASSISEDNNFLNSIVKEKNLLIDKISQSAFQEASKTISTTNYQQLILKIFFQCFYLDKIEAEDALIILNVKSNSNTSDDANNNLENEEILNRDRVILKYFKKLILDDFGAFLGILKGSNPINSPIMKLKEFSTILENCKIEAELSNSKNYHYQKAFFPLIRIMKNFFYMNFGKQKLEKIKSKIFELRSNVDKNLTLIKEIEKRNSFMENLKQKFTKNNEDNSHRNNLQINNIINDKMLDNTNANDISNTNISNLNATNTLVNLQNSNKNLMLVHQEVLKNLNIDNNMTTNQENKDLKLLPSSYSESIIKTKNNLIQKNNTPLTPNNISSKQPNSFNKSLPMNPNNHISINNRNSSNLNSTIQELENFSLTKMSSYNQNTNHINSNTHLSSSFDLNDYEEEKDEESGYKGLIIDNLNSLKLIQNNLEYNYISLIKGLSKQLIKPKDVFFLKQSKSNVTVAVNINNSQSKDSNLNAFTSSSLKNLSAFEILNDQNDNNNRSNTVTQITKLNSKTVIYKNSNKLGN